MLSISSFSSFFVFNYKSDAILETSATNYLFNGKPYPFELNDFYDDEDLDHVWTGAKFQMESFNDTELAWSGTINNDTVTPVNNTETQYGASSGHFPATYSFEGETGETNLDISFVGFVSGDDTGKLATVVAEED